MFESFPDSEDGVFESFPDSEGIKTCSVLPEGINFGNLSVFESFPDSEGIKTCQAFSFFSLP